MAADVDQLTADALAAGEAFRRAQHDGASPEVQEEKLSVGIYLVIDLGRELAKQANLPAEHPFAAFRRGSDHLMAVKNRQ